MISDADFKLYSASLQGRQLIETSHSSETTYQTALIQAPVGADQRESLALKQALMVGGRF